ncbi:RNA-binding protein 28 [Cydia splendana]|uniref:RNA-binding protein 28 n=1 Tax=Cydia splendana TaxID=1100963 RepID=UPI0028F4BF3C
MSEEESNVNSNTKYKDGVNRNARLIVRNISFKATEESLKEHFASYGTVEEVKLLKKPDGKLVGCGFVHFTHVPQANKAMVATNKKPFLGRPIFVSWAVSKDKYTEQNQGTEKGPKKRLNSGASADDSKDDVQEIKSEDSKAKKNEPRINRNARLIVRNVSFKASEESLREHFEPYGTIHEVKLLKKPDGKLVGCAFVHFKNVPMAKKALLNTNMKPYLGRPISVDWAVAKDKYMQFVVNKQIEMEDEVKKEESDSDDDDKPPINIANDELKQEVKSESDEDSAESDDEKDSEADDDSDEKEEGDDDEGEEDEDDEDAEDEEMDNQSETSTIAERQRIKLNDAEDGRTVFITNIPFSVDNDQLRAFVENTGPVQYALVCVDKMTEHSKGSGFVKFEKEEDAKAFLALPADALRLEGQALQPRPALKRESLQKASKQPKDNRNLYLVKEGVIVAGTKAAVGVSASDMAKRLALERSKTQMLKNLNRFVSRYRLVVSNLPANTDDNRLRRICVSASGKQAVVTECRVMRDLRALVGTDGKHLSKGYGFVMLTRHEDALACLRKLNNNPDIFDKNNRPIVSFSIEDRTALNARKKRLEKSIANNPLANKEDQHKKKNRKRKHPSQPDESYVKKGRFERKPGKNDNQNEPKHNGFNKRGKQNHNEPGKFVRKPRDDEETEYSGLTAKEGAQHKMRSFHKLRTQADIHRQQVKMEKKKGGNWKLKMAARERVKQPKQGINKNPDKKRRRPNRNAKNIR